MAIDTVTILDVRVDCVDFAQTLTLLDTWITERAATIRHAGVQWTRNTQEPFGQATRQICTVNPEIIMYAHRDSLFAAVLQRTDLSVPDGIGILWAARQQGIHLHERVTGSDGIYCICERAADAGWTVYLLGAADGVAANAAFRLQQRYPGLQVVGTYSGSPADDDWPTIAQRLQYTEPDILFVAFGHPRQELWIDQHRDELPAKVAVGVGGAFDFVAGVTQRAPRWLQRLGLEWLYRLLTQPWRWRRMLVLPHFVWLVLWAKRDRMIGRVGD